MARSLIRQLEQIRRSSVYDDQVVDVNTSAVAEPTVSGSLEDDLNVIRTLTKELKGTTDWFGDLGNYFDPTNTTSGSAEQKDFNLLNLKNHTLDATTVIVPVVDNNNGMAYSVSGTQTGILMELNTQYAVATDRRGLPIFSSISGTYWDEGGSLNVCRADIVSAANGQSVVTPSGHVVYGLFHDGKDFGGSGDGTDVYLKFYANGVEVGFPTGYETSTTVVSGSYVPPSGDEVNFDFSGGYVTPSGNLLEFDFTDSFTTGGIQVIYPRRRVMDNVQEYEWFRTDFVNKFEGDAELVEDMRNIWSYTGAVDGTSSTAGSWTNASGSYPLSSDPGDLFTAIDLLNTDFGDMNWGALNYVSIGDDIAEALIALDAQVKANADSILAGSEDKYIEEVVGGVAKNTYHVIPGGVTYTPFSTVGQEGKNMDVIVNGQLLMASTGLNGINADRDYAETNSSGITFHAKVSNNSIVVYRIRQ